MMRVAGVVQRVEGPKAWVEVTPSGGCGRCHEPGGCGGVNITRALDQGKKLFCVDNEIGAKPGENVAVLIADGLPLRAALLVYGLPVLGVIAGAWFGMALAASGREDLGALLGAVLGIAVGALVGRSRWQHVVSPVRLQRESADTSRCGA